ncbi:cold-shock protein [Rhodoblastus acidophilus]|nr:cold shock domain-containing protein [Rhodoblastus acidophilus]
MPLKYPAKTCKFDRRLRPQACWLVQKGVSMSQETVEGFNPQNGFSFIALDGGGQDDFAHSGAVERVGATQWRESDGVLFELVARRGGNISAEKIKIVN